MTFVTFPNLEKNVNFSMVEIKFLLISRTFCDKIIFFIFRNPTSSSCFAQNQFWRVISFTNNIQTSITIYNHHGRLSFSFSIIHFFCVFFTLHDLSIILRIQILKSFFFANNMQISPSNFLTSQIHKIKTELLTSPDFSNAVIRQTHPCAKKYAERSESTLVRYYYAIYIATRHEKKPFSRSLT